MGLEEDSLLAFSCYKGHLSIFVLQTLISYFFLTVKFRSSLSSSLFDVYDRYTAYCNSILRILTWLVRCTSVIVLLRKERLFFRASMLCHIILEYFRHRVNLLKTILKLSFDVEIVCDNIIYTTNCKLHRELEKKVHENLKMETFFS